MGHVCGVEYEGLHIIYFHCGQYSYRQELCSKIVYELTLPNIVGDKCMIVDKVKRMNEVIGFRPWILPMHSRTGHLSWSNEGGILGRTSYKGRQMQHRTNPKPGKEDH